MNDDGSRKVRVVLHGCKKRVLLRIYEGNGGQCLTKSFVKAFKSQEEGTQMKIRNDNRVHNLRGSFSREPIVKVSVRSHTNKCVSNRWSSGGF